jgi:hypothetical protein
MIISGMHYLVSGLTFSNAYHMFWIKEYNYVAYGRSPLSPISN